MIPKTRSLKDHSLVAEPLSHDGESYGAEVQIRCKSQAREVIADVLIPDAIIMLSRMYPDDHSKIIEIRGKVCTRHPYFSKHRVYLGRECPDSHKGRYCCALAWLHFWTHGQESNIPDHTMRDFDPVFRPAGGKFYYPVDRIEVPIIPGGWITRKAG